MESVFSHQTYKAVMKDRLLGGSNRGQLSRAAEFLNSQRSFLSRVMNTEIHLTPDHAYELTRFWEMPKSEAEYFQALVEFDRAASPKFREHIKEKITAMKRAHDALNDRVERPKIMSGERELVYYSSWLWSAVHILTSVPKYQTVEALARHLNLPAMVVKNSLEQLNGYGMVNQRSNKWEFTSGELHLAKESPLVTMHHQNWRARAMLDAQMHHADSVHFTNIQSLSLRDYERVKEIILDAISAMAKVAGPSDPEEVMIFSCDLFKT